MKEIVEFVKSSMGAKGEKLSEADLTERATNLVSEVTAEVSAEAAAEAAMEASAEAASEAFAEAAAESSMGGPRFPFMR